MKRSRVVLAGACTLLLVLTFSLVGCTSAKTSSTTQLGASQTLDYQIMTGTMDIPLYPGAELIGSSLRENEPGFGGFFLKSQAEISEVKAFYVQALSSANGWKLIREEGDEYTLTLGFLWTNITGGPPARRILSLIIDNVTKKGAEVEADFGPWPDSNNVPHMPDAQHVENQWDRGLSRGFQDDSLVKVTTFTTASTPTEVEAFYKKTMPEYGWGLAVYVPHPGIAFSYNKIDPYGVKGEAWEVWSYVVISTKQMANGSTKVMIEASGTGLTQK